MNLYQLAEAFRDARIDSRQTQEDVANATGISIQTISKFERGALTEIGTVKLIALCKQVGLEIIARPAGHRRTLDDIGRELNDQINEPPRAQAKRVRHGKTGQVRKTKSGQTP